MSQIDEEAKAVVATLGPALAKERAERYLGSHNARLIALGEAILKRIGG